MRYSFVNDMWWMKVCILACLMPYGCVLGAEGGSILAPILQSLNMTSAILHYYQEFFNKHTKSTTVAVRANDDKNWTYFSDLLTSVLIRAHDLKVGIDAKSGKRQPISFSFYNILLIDSFGALADLDPGFHAQQNDFSEYYLIAMPSTTNSSLLSAELKRIFEYCWRHYIVNVDVLVDLNDNRIELYTYFPFSPHECKSTEPARLSQGKSITELSRSEIFPDKVRSFYGCPVTGVLWQVPPYVILPDQSQDVARFGGIEGNLLNVLVDKLNFSLDYNEPPHNEQRGLVMANGTLTGAIKILAEKSGDLSAGCIRRTLERSTVLTSSISFYQNKQVLIVLTRHEPWSTYEILTYPFNIYVWSSLLIFYLLPIFLACLLQRLSVRALKFIYGVVDTREMIFTWTGVLVAHITHKTTLPVANFARYIFVMWLLLTLILRSSYQALLYEFFNTQKVIAAPSSLEDLIKNGYKLIVNRATADAVSQIKVVLDGQIELLALDVSDTGVFNVLEENPHEYYVTSAPSDFLKYHTISERKPGRFHVLRDELFVHHISMFFSKHSYLQQPVNSILRSLRSGGIIEFWSELYIGSIPRVKEEGHIQKRPLTMAQLKGIFEVQYCLWGLAFLVFLVECVHGRHILKKWKGGSFK